MTKQTKKIYIDDFKKIKVITFDNCDETTSNDVFEMAYESYINGQHKQMVSQLNSYGESFSDFIGYVQDVMDAETAVKVAVRCFKEMGE